MEMGGIRAGTLIATSDERTVPKSCGRINHFVPINHLHDIIKEIAKANMRCLGHLLSHDVLSMS